MDLDSARFSLGDWSHQARSFRVGCLLQRYCHHRVSDASNPLIAEIVISGVEPVLGKYFNLALSPRKREYGDGHFVVEVKILVVRQNERFTVRGPIVGNCYGMNSSFHIGGSFPVLRFREL